MIKVVTSSREETIGIALSLGLLLHGGDILCLDGDLGAGKTAFTYGIAKGLGIRGVISSPTFTILIEHTKHEINDNEYSGVINDEIIDMTPNPGMNANNRKEKLPLYHFDAYRLSSADEFYDLGFDEYFSFNGVCVIEWAEQIRQAIPPNAIWITIKQGSFDVSDQRILNFIFPNGDSRGRLLSEKINELKRRPL